MASPSRPIPSPEFLSPYHRRVVEFMAHGYSDTEIALRLGSNRDAIRAVVFRIIRSAGVRNRPHLIYWFAAPHAITPVTHDLSYPHIRLTS